MGPRMVTWQAIFSFLRIPKWRTVYRALEVTGDCPVSCSRTFEARVSLSPDSPTEMSREIELSAKRATKSRRARTGEAVERTGRRNDQRRALSRPPRINVTRTDDKLLDLELLHGVGGGGLRVGLNNKKRDGQHQLFIRRLSDRGARALSLGRPRADPGQGGCDRSCDVADGKRTGKEAFLRVVAKRISLPAAK